MDSTTIVWLFGSLACLAAAVGHFASNALLRILAAEEPELWRRLGEPSGLFAPPRGRNRLSSLARSPASAWLTRTPVWVAKCPRARLLLRMNRIAIVILIFAVLTLLAVRVLA